MWLPATTSLVAPSFFMKHCKYFPKWKRWFPAWNRVHNVKPSILRATKNTKKTSKPRWFGMTDSTWPSALKAMTAMTWDDLGFFPREPQHTPRSIPQTFPTPPNERNSFINCWLGVWGLQESVGKFLDFFIFQGSHHYDLMISIMYAGFQMRWTLPLASWLREFQRHMDARYPVTRYYGTLEGVSLANPKRTLPSETACSNSIKNW